METSQNAVRRGKTKRNPFECEVCGQEFARKHLLEYHMNRHLGVAPYACDVCGFKSSCPSNLDKHKSIHSKEKRFACEFCDYKSARFRNLKTHVMAIHTGDKPFKCDHCEYRAVNSGHLKKHLKTQHMKGTCDTCGFAAEGRRELDAHMKLKHGRIKRYHCDRCPFFSKHVALLVEHFEAEHVTCSSTPAQSGKEIKTPIQQPSLYKAQLPNSGSLPIQSDKRIESLVQQQLAANNAQPSDSENCSSKENTKQMDMDLDVHQCKICDYRAFSMPELEFHVTDKHGGEKPYACTKCDYKGKTRRYLDSHMTSHSEEKLFACVECNYRGTSKPLLAKHRKSMHSGRQRPVAPSRRTGNSATADSHQSSASKNYDCKNCEYRANAMKDLKSHVLSVHNRGYIVFEGRQSERQRQNHGGAQGLEQDHQLTKAKGNSTKYSVARENNRGIPNGDANRSTYSHAVAQPQTELCPKRIPNEPYTNKANSKNSVEAKKTNSFLEVFENFLDKFS